MEYSELNYLVKKNETTLKSLAEEMGLTPLGLRKGIENHTLMDKHIEMICKKFEITPNEFFGWSEEDKGTIVAHHIGGNNEQNGGAALAILSAQLKEKDRQIERLIRALGGTESAQKRGKK